MESHDPSYTAMRTSEALARGLTPGQLRGPAFLTAAHGLVKPARLDEDPVWSRISIATGLMTPGCVLGGWASLRVQGNLWFGGTSATGDRPALVHCAPHTRIRRRSAVEPFRGLVHPDEVIYLENYPVTTMARAAFDEMRVAPNLREAVVVLDLATSTTIGMPHTTPAAIHQVTSAHHKVRGLVQVREALTKGSTRSASSWETRTRLLAELDADIPRLRVNVPLFGPREQLLGVADLLDERSGLVIESDGGDHRENVRHTDDNRREERFERAGLVVCRVTSLDHADRWGTVGRLAAALRDARRSTRRDWTTRQPTWWTTWPPARLWD